MSKNILKEISAREFDLVVKEIAKRTKNIVFMNAEQKTRDVLKTILEKDVIGKDEQFISQFNVGIDLGEIEEIIGGIRRK